MKYVRKLLKGICFAGLFLITILPVKALTVWKYEDWQAGTNYGSKVKVSSNITNLKGEKEEIDGMKRGPFNKASTSSLSDGIKEDVYVGLKKDDYQNGELFELSIAINKKEDNKEPEYLTEAVVMTQKSGDKFVITANWTKDKNPIAEISEDGVYTYRWEYQKTKGNKLQVKFTILDYGKEIASTDFVELEVNDASKALNVRYLWACNIKASYGVDIYTTLPPKPNQEENPETGDIHLGYYIALITLSSASLIYVFQRKLRA